MAEIVLTGLPGDAALGFLAALGALRHAATVAGWDPVTLHWAPHSGQWRPVLTASGPLDRATLLRALAGRAEALREGRPELQWADQVKKTAVPAYRTEAARQRATHGAWFAAFASELCRARDGTLRSTPFDMTGGQQKFLEKLRGLSAALARSPRQAEEALDEALFGPWQYKPATNRMDREVSHSLGLDPATLLEGAFTAEAPTTIADKRGIRGAVWLAFEALPLFPCVAVRGQPLAPGFHRDGRTLHFCWTLWDVPLSVVAARALLAQEPDLLRARAGVVRQYRSARVNLNKDYYTLGPAELVVG